MVNFNLSSDIDLGIVTINSKLLILGANKRFEDLYGLKEKATLYKKTKLAEIAAASFEQKKGISGILIQENVYDAPSHYLIYSCTFYEEGDYIQTMIVCDISGQFRYWESSVKEEKSKQMGDMAAGIANIILNPLAVIKGFIQLIEQGIRGISPKTSNDYQSIETYLSLINQEANNIHSHIQRLLQIGKPFEMELTHDSLTSILQEFIPYVQQEALDREFRFVFEFPNQDIKLLVHRAYLKKVFREILNNSFEATSKGGKLDIEIDVMEKHVLFRITDFGEGIPCEIKNEIMRPFFTTKEDSVGLGLSFCDVILQKMGGRLEILSSRGKTVVNVFLPIIRF